MTLTESLRKYRAISLMTIKRWIFAAPSVFYSGQARYCSVCEKSSRKFVRHGVARRPDAKCMRCGALERHRFVWLFFKRRTNLFNDKSKKMLHFAPVPFLEKSLRKYFKEGYLTADLYDPKAMIKMDITDIQYPDNSFDVIYCSHVLEHVPDDKQAMRELRRVLKPDGWAMLLVPIMADETFEDPSITDPKERLKYFGQEDHVRAYGPDFSGRLKEAGFEVEVVYPDSLLSDDEIERMGITEGAGEIFYCR